MQGVRLGCGWLLVCCEVLTWRGLVWCGCWLLCLLLGLGSGGVWLGCGRAEWVGGLGVVGGNRLGVERCGVLCGVSVGWLVVD